jgi:hypothetical protein
LFEKLITIPFYEWYEVEGDNEKEEEYLKSNLLRESEGRQRNLI